MIFSIFNDPNRATGPTRDKQKDAKLINTDFIFIVIGCCPLISINKFKKCIPFLFSVIIDILIFYITLMPWIQMKNVDEVSFKKEASESCITLTNLAFRIWMHKSGFALTSVSLKVQKLRIIISNSSENIKKKLLIIFTINSFFNLGFVPLCVINVYHDKEDARNYLRIFYLEHSGVFVSYLYFSFLYILLVWFITALPSMFCIYFYFVCYQLKKSVVSFMELASQGNEIPFENIPMKYTAVYQTFMKVNKALETPMLIICIQISMCFYYGLYITLFDTDFNEHFIPTAVLVLLNSAMNFILLCSFASSVTKSYATMKFSVHRLLLRGSTEELLSLALKVSKSPPMQFTLLDSMALDKSLIICAFGTLLTYGIMIATLGKTRVQCA